MKEESSRNTKMERRSPKGTISEREKPIILRRSYRLNWKNYSDIKFENGTFKYLLIKIERGNK